VKLTGFLFGGCFLGNYFGFGALSGNLLLYIVFFFHALLVSYFLCYAVQL